MQKIFYTLVLLAIFGCDEETIDVFDYPTILVATEYEVLTDVRLFTKKGQITDNAVINSYLKKDTKGIFYKNKESYFPISKPDTVIYYSKDTVLFSLPGEWGKRLPKKTGAYIYFSMPDTLIGFKSIDQEEPFSEIIRQIGIVKPYYEALLPSAYGSQYQKVFDAFIAKGDPRKLEFPRMTYRITRRQNNSYAEASRTNYNNVFDPNVVKLLQDGDTLAIQEARVIYMESNKQ